MVTETVRFTQEISSQLATIMDRHRITKVVAELPHGGAKSASAMRCMAIATAIVAATCAVKQVPLVAVTPNEIKRLVAPGQRKVPKQAVQAYITKRFGQKNLPKLKGELEHIADAIGALAVYLDRR